MIEDERRGVTVLVLTRTLTPLPSVLATLITIGLDEDSSVHTKSLTTKTKAKH